MIFIPLQQKTTKDYVRHTTQTAFVIFMLWLVSFFYDEYQDAELKKKHAVTTIAQITEQAKSESNKISIPPPPPNKQDREPTGGSKPPELPNTTQEEAIKSIPGSPKLESSGDSKIEIDAWLVKVAMSNEASWMAIFKMVFTVLFTFFGIKLINFGFRKLEGEPKPA